MVTTFAVASGFARPDRPVLATSEMLQHLLGLRSGPRLPCEQYVEFAFASAVYSYGGWPFLTGLVDELRKRLPG